MSFPVARVGSMTKGGDEISTGASSHFVDGATGGASVSVTFNGSVVVFDEKDMGTVGHDEPGADGPALSSDPIRNNQLMGAGGSVGEAAPSGENDSHDIPVGCIGIQTAPTFQLSPNFTIADLTTGPSCSAGRNSLSAQHGLSTEAIACNLKALATNILEPFIAHFGKSNLLISSGFRWPDPRGGSTISQHELGMAADLHLPALGNNQDQLIAAATWCRDNLHYDQLIYEFNGHSYWIHMSYNRSATKQRLSVLTCGNAGTSGTSYSQGLFRINA